jgi:hypothetical protein
VPSNEKLTKYTKIHGNDGAYICKKRSHDDAYVDGKYVKIKRDELIINLLQGRQA